MVSERQRLARKRYKEAHPELFPASEPTPPKDPTKTKKKKSLFKHKKPVSNDPSKRNSFRKHPLRVPGMRPGDSCYICRANDHIAKVCPEKAQWEKNKICLSCRQRGHSLKNCPNKNEESAGVKVCYNCGEAGHSLFNCTQPIQDGGTKFASCFICKGRGHLSKECPKNAHGIYPKGGCCKICGGVTHLARDCPEKGKRNPYATSASASGYGYADMADLPRPQVTKLTSGDDLEDDFVMEEKSTARKNTDVDSSVPEKSKKKQGTKVVNFVG